MARYPRRVSRGPLKGNVYQTEGEYRRALGELKGKTRYQERNERARKLGYKSYGERRRKLRQMKDRNQSFEIPNMTLRERVEYEIQNWKNRNTKQRIDDLGGAAQAIGVEPRSVYAIFYQRVDALKLR